MTDDTFNQVRDQDHAVLECIHDGQDDTRQIREATTLANHTVNHALDRLEDRGLIETHTPDGRVTQIIDGQKRNFKAPRQAQLTDHGREYLAQTDRDQTKYRGMTHDEVVERVQDLEQEIESLQNAFETFRQQVLKKLE